MVQKRVNLVDLEHPEKMRLLSLSEASIQKRTSPPKFYHLAAKSRPRPARPSRPPAPRTAPGLRRRPRPGGSPARSRAPAGAPRPPRRGARRPSARPRGARARPSFDFGKLWQMLTNFRRSVLGRIDSYDSENRRILQLFSRSTRLAYFCSSPTAKC